MKDPHDIILRPVLTEKAYEGIGDKRYIFEVAVGANKTEIKLALESIFAEDGVKVEKVNTVRTPVSYTHLDVYKRQDPCPGRRPGWAPEEAPRHSFPAYGSASHTPGWGR